MSVAASKKWLMVVMFMVLVLAAMPLLSACSDDDDDTATRAATTPPTTAAPTGELLTIDSKLGALMDNPDTKAILEKHLPEAIITSPRLMSLGASLTIPEIAPASGGLITDEMLEAIAAELEDLGAYAAPAATTTAPAQTTSEISGEPVKIGVLCAWTGSSGIAGLLVDQAVKVAEYMVKEKGGVLGGRPVKFERYDSQGQVARAQAGVIKLAGDPDVLAITIGGVTSGEMEAAEIATSELHVPFFTTSTGSELPKYQYSVRATVVDELRASLCVDYILDNFDAKTAAYLTDNTDDARRTMKSAREKLEAAGVETVYEEYLTLGTTDLSPYLTKIKYSHPDVFIHYHSAGATVPSMYKQVTELGGWGDIKVMSVSTMALDAAKEKGAEGTYVWVGWLPGLPYPGAKTFEQAWQEVHGDTPNSFHPMLYQAIWSAVEAIDQAGADREAIAKLIRSGTFGWESPTGPLLIGTDGEPNIKGVVAMIKDGKAAPAP